MLEEITHPWKRYWLVREAEPPLNDQGFLLNPESAHSKYFQSGLQRFESISTTECLILLGEAGIGKSKALEEAFQSVSTECAAANDTALFFDLRDYSTDIGIKTEIFQSPQVLRWQADQSSILHLFLDSFDEGLLEISNLSAILMSNLKLLSVGRLRLRLACRPSDWPASFEKSLGQLWGEKKVGVWQLAPLTRNNVRTAAESHRVSADAFVAALLKSETVPLAIKPVTLAFLLGEFLNGDPLTSNRYALYLNGCTRLCDEMNPDRADSAKGRGRRTAQERLMIAARFGAIMQFAQKSGIWRGPDTKCPPSFLSIGQLVELGESSYTKDDVMEVLNKGLFMARGPDIVDWRHHSYAEFLAAHYLQVQNTSREHKRQLLQHSDDSGKIVPQLRETALWLAGVDEQFFDLLMDVDPEMLVRADFANGSEARKEGLLQRLLTCFDDGTLTPDRDLRWLWGRVATTGVDQIIEPYLCERSHSEESRHAAIVIARECKATGLGTHVAGIALDPAENDNLRSEAAAAVFHIGESNSRRMLKPLIFGNIGSDPEDTLKGYALRCNWPDNMTATELFIVLMPQKRPHFMGSYKAFLESEVTAGLQPADSPKSIEWAANYAGGRDPFDVLGKLASRVLGFSAQKLEVRGVVDLLAATLFKQWKLHFEINNVRGVIVMAGDEARHRVARALLPISVQDEHRWLATIEICSLGDHDLQWLLKEYLGEDNAALKQYLAELIGKLLTSRDVEAWDAVLTASDGDGILRTAIRDSVGPVLLDSDLAKRWRQLEADRSASIQDQPPAKIEHPLESVRRTFLCTCPSSFYQAFSHLVQGGFSWSPSPILEMWENMDEELRQKTLAAAGAYLRTRPAVGGPRWWCERTMTWNILAGYAALYIVALKTPEALDELTSDDWDFWTCVILAEQMGPGEDATRNFLLSKAYVRSEGVFLATLSDLIEADDERFQMISALDSLGSLWNEDIGALVLQFLRRPISPKTFQALLAKALRRGVPNAVILAEQLATGPVPPGGPDREKAIIAAIELAAYEPSMWPALWRVWQVDLQRAMDLLGHVASQDYFNLGFAATLDDESLADLYLWIAEHVDLAQGWIDSDSSTIDQQLARWSNTIVSLLARKGTVESCSAVRRIVAALPQFGGLRSMLKEAEERTRRAHWIPFHPATVIEVASNPNARVIRNGAELLELLEESLERLEAELQGVTPTAEALWDGNPNEMTEEYRRQAELKGAPEPPRLFRPKSEGALSDSVKKHLERDLRDSGIVLNREVQIRRPLGARQGETTDIYVDVMVPTIKPEVVERLSAVIEVKGCWNRGVKTDMQIQLANRYMTDSGIDVGLYLVGWYECVLWDRKDYRWSDRLKLSLAEARAFFAQQAQVLTRGSRCVRSFVLDVRLR